MLPMSLACGSEESEHARLGSEMRVSGAIAELEDERDDPDFVDMTQGSSGGGRGRGGHCRARGVCSTALGLKRGTAGVSWLTVAGGRRDTASEEGKEAGVYIR